MIDSIYKRTPLSLAARYDHFACVSVLLKSHALVNQYDMYGYNSLETHINCRRTANTAMAMLLWAAGEIIDASRVDIPPCLRHCGMRSLKQRLSETTYSAVILILICSIECPNFLCQNYWYLICYLIYL